MTKKWKPIIGKAYWTIMSDFSKVSQRQYFGGCLDCIKIDSNNYFETKSEAIKKLKEIKNILKK